MINNLINEHEYTKKIVIFIDVLGIGEFSLKKENEKKLLRFYSLVKNLEQNYTPFNKIISHKRGSHSLSIDHSQNKKLDYNFNILSDAFVISFNRKDLLFIQDFSRFARIIYFLALIELGLMCKGAISIGKIYQHKGISTIFGEGLCLAAKMEKRESEPRIIMDNRVVQRVQKLYDNESKLKSLVEEYKEIGVIKESSENLIAQIQKASFEGFFFKDTDNKMAMRIFSDIDYILKELSTKLSKNITKEKLILKAGKTITEIECKSKKGLNDEQIRQEERKLRRWQYLHKQLKEAT